MNPIDAQFARMRAAGRPAFMPFLPAGDPDLAFTRELIPAVAAAGADLIEVGFPFSDPIADGPVIQASYTRALKHGVKLDDLFASIGEAARASAATGVALVGMASYSLIYRKGIDAFLIAAQQAGLSGAVVPDLPVEEAEELAKKCQDHDFKLILLVTPTTAPERAERIVKVCGGFVYVVSVVGITGARAAVSDQVRPVIARLRTMTDLPLCIGFGVSTLAQVRELRDIADGIIVGSALVKLLENAGNPTGRASAITNVTAAVRDLSAALH